MYRKTTYYLLRFATQKYRWAAFWFLHANNVNNPAIYLYLCDNSTLFSILLYKQHIFTHICSNMQNNHILIILQFYGRIGIVVLHINIA